MSEQLIFRNDEVRLNELPVIENTYFHPLERSYRSILILSAVLTWCAVVLAAWLITPSVGLPVLVSLRLTLALMLAAVFSGLAHLVLIALGFRLKGYAVRDRDITYKTGLLMRRQTSIPYSRIQHVEVRQGILERYFKLGKLNIYTAGGQSSDLSIPGLRNEDAQNLKAFILRTMESDEEE